MSPSGNRHVLSSTVRGMSLTQLVSTGLTSGDVTLKYQTWGKL